MTPPGRTVDVPAGREQGEPVAGPDAAPIQPSGGRADVAAAEKRAPRARLIAFYLPQFHPIPENDAWWGAGFTEWTNVTKAQPLFTGHFQPRLPADLGFYDLRLPEIRAAQASLARAAGIEGFCYYHYWFAGKELLDRPLKDVVRLGAPDFPFCVCWANQSWSGIWHGNPAKILIEQTYPGRADDEAHFASLLPAFRDPRYIKIDGRLLFTIFRPRDLPDSTAFVSRWQRLAEVHGLPGFHFTAHLHDDERAWPYRRAGFDSAIIVNNLKGYRVGPEMMLQHQWRQSQALPSWKHRFKAKHRALRNYGWYCWQRARGRIGGRFRNIVRYEDAIPFFLEDLGDDVFPCAVPNWDNTARSGERGFVLHESTPYLFGTHLQQAVNLVENRAPSHRVIFVKSWNEWAEGNYLEPDRRFGHQYLDVIRNLMFPTTAEAEDR